MVEISKVEFDYLKPIKRHIISGKIKLDKHKLLIYHLVGFMSIGPIVYDMFDVGILNYNYLDINKIFLFMIAVIIFFINHKLLRFKKYFIEHSVEDFNKAVNLSIIDRNWEVIERTDNLLIAADTLSTNYRARTFNKVVTIYRVDNRIYINSMNEPSFGVYSVSFLGHYLNINSLKKSLFFATKGEDEFNNYYKKVTQKITEKDSIIFSTTQSVLKYLMIVFLFIAGLLFIYGGSIILGGILTLITVGYFIIELIVQLDK